MQMCLVINYRYGVSECRVGAFVMGLGKISSVFSLHLFENKGDWLALE